MSEPDYIAQADNPEKDEDRQRWVRAHCDEAKAAGCIDARVSICPPGTWPHLNLILFEGWKEPPADQGEPRWQLTAERTKHHG